MRRTRIGVVAVLVAWTLFWSLIPLRGLFWLPPGYVDPITDSTLTVTDVEPGGAAQRARVHLGDRFDPSTSFENRLYLQQIHNPRAGQVLTLRVVGKSGARIVRLRSASQAPYDAGTVAYSFTGAMIDLIFVVVGTILLLLRPSKMTWAFFFYCVATVPSLILGAPWLSGSIVFSNGVFADALRAFGFGMFLVFCARAPNNRVVGKSRYVERLAPVVSVSVFACSIAIDLSIAGILQVDKVAGNVQGYILGVTYVIGIAALIVTFFRERGVARSRVAWIIAGFAIGLGSRLAANVIDGGSYMYTGLSNDTSWAAFTAEVFQLAIPFAVAYTVVRHHALNAGTIANRTLVYGVAACAAFGVFALLDVLVTKRFARNQFEVGLDIAVALAIGLSFQFWHPRATRLVDRVFLPDRYRAAIALDGLQTTLGAIRGEDDIPNRAVEAVARELLLCSLAVFKKLPDGGFVRYAAVGWPKGSTWHIYPEDALARSFGEGARIRALNEEHSAGLNVPAEPGRPKIGMLLCPRTAAESLMLVGAHLNGRRPDRDEVRGIASLLRDGALGK